MPTRPSKSSPCRCLLLEEKATMEPSTAARGYAHMLSGSDKVVE